MLIACHAADAVPHRAGVRSGEGQTAAGADDHWYFPVLSSVPLVEGGDDEIGVADLDGTMIDGGGSVVGIGARQSQRAVPLPW